MERLFHTRLGKVLVNNNHLAAIFVAAAFLFSWFVTFGTFRFFEKSQHPGHVYDSLAAHMWSGDVQVDREEVGPEAFVIDGRTLTYFGPAPAFPRMLLNRIFPEMYGRWSVLSLLAALLGTMALAVILLRNLRVLLWPEASRSRGTECFLAAMTGFGCTTVFLSAGASVYHEAIAWGTFLALLSAIGCVKFWQSGKRIYFLLAAVCALLAFFTRVTAGLGPLSLLAAIGILHLFPRALSDKIHFRRSASTSVVFVGIGTVVLTLVLFVSYNHARFHTWFDSVPIRYHILYDPERIARINGTFTNFGLVPQNAKAYLWYPSLRSDPVFPWIHFDWQWVKKSPGLDYDLIEPLVSLSYSMPALVILALAGFGYAGWLTRRDSRPLLLAAALLGNGISLLALAFLSERYLHDWMPGLLTAACIALLWMERLPHLRITLAIAWLVLAWNIFAMVSLTFVYQRHFGWGQLSAQRRVQLWSISRFIGGLAEGITPTRTPRMIRMQHNAPEGWCDTAEMVMASSPPSLSYCDKFQWIVTKSALVEDFTMTIPPFSPSQPPEPLITARGPGGSDTVFLSYEDRHIRIGFHHSGSKEVLAPGATLANEGDVFRVLVILDPDSQMASVRINENEVLHTSVQFFNWDRSKILVGQNPDGGPIASRFSGSLLTFWTGDDYETSAPPAIRSPVSRQSGVPVITSLGPSETRAGVPFNRQADGTSALAISGEGFDSTSKVTANGRELPLAFGNSNWVTTTVPNDLFASEGVVWFRIRNGNGKVSDQIAFRVTR